jgi:hypothetical protein
MLISIFVKAPPHVPLGLMAPKSTISHMTISVAGATRVDLVIS